MEKSFIFYCIKKISTIFAMSVEKHRHCLYQCSKTPEEIRHYAPLA